MIMTGRYLLNRYCPCIILHGCHWMFNTLQPRHNGRYFPDDIFICIFLNENVWISIKISLTYVPWGRMNDIPALVQIMAWRLLGDKPLSEPMLVSLPMHISVTQPQWVKHWFSSLWLCRVILCLLGSEKKKKKPDKLSASAEALFINALCPGNTMWHQGTGATLVQAMACPIVPTKPLSEPGLAYC